MDVDRLAREHIRRHKHRVYQCEQIVPFIHASIPATAVNGSLLLLRLHLSPQTFSYHLAAELVCVAGYVPAYHIHDVSVDQITNVECTQRSIFRFVYKAYANQLNPSLYDQS